MFNLYIKINFYRVVFVTGQPISIYDLKESTSMSKCECVEYDILVHLF